MAGKMGRSSYDKLGPDVEYGYGPVEYGYGAATATAPRTAGYGEPCAGWERHDRAMRQGFLQKVLTIVFVQLLVTAGICGAMAGIAPIRASVLGPQAGVWMFVMLTPFLFLAGTIAAQACTRCAAGGGPVFDVLRAHPWNLVWLFAFTVLEGLSLGVTTIVAASSGGSQAVLLATLITVALVLGLLLFSLQTRIDFTPYTGMGCGLVLCLILFGAIAPFNNTVDLVYAGGGALIFCFLLVVDLQLMMSGKRVQIGPDDYVPAAINIYLDIINIFFYVLQLVQSR